MREGAAAAGALLLLAICPVAVPAASPAHRPVVVERVVDGDTFDARDGDRVVRVRLIGIDTPELHSSAKLDAQVRRGWDRALITRLGRRAADAARRLLEVGKVVRLELDVETHDRYGRLLAYVWRGDVLVNAELLREGQATCLTIPPNVRYARWFRHLEAAAREARRGLWTTWPPLGSPSGASRTRPRHGADPQRTPAARRPSSLAALRATRPSGRARTGRGTGPACARRSRSMALQSLA